MIKELYNITKGLLVTKRVTLLQRSLAPCRSRREVDTSSNKRDIPVKDSPVIENIRSALW